MSDETQTVATATISFPEPTVARIAKIGLSDYRAFPSGQTYEFDLSSTGKNLLLHGENGSGKTSLFRALKDLTALNEGPANFADLRYMFAPGEEGFVAVEMTAGTPNEFRWDYGDEHPRTTAGQPYASLAERCRFLDYKALLETNFVHRTKKPNLFDLLVKDLLRNLLVIIDGKPLRLSEVYRRVVTAKPYPYPGRLKLMYADWACQAFNTALLNHLPEVVQEGNRIVAQLGYDGLSFDLTPTPLSYDRNTRSLVGQEIVLSVRLFNKSVEHPQVFLNEARLTAIALAIYLGAAKLVLTSPSAGTDGTTKVRLLVLDDVLIGLDLSNRIPVLRVLNEEFGDWQIILMTYDDIWFELARESTKHSGQWKYLKIREMNTVPGQPGLPCIEPCPDLLSIAEGHLKSGGLVAAAVHIRDAFEARLKNVCRDCGIKISYKPNPKDVKADHLWQGILDRQKERQDSGKADFIPQVLVNDVETVRSTVLNRLSHAGATGLVLREVQCALETVKRLQQHQFTKV